MEWRAATTETVSKIVEEDLKECGEEEAAAFAKYRVELYRAPISRYGRDESVVVVARKQNEVIYWEDVEEGFNRSPVSTDGRILEHLCNQEDLCLALHPWTTETGFPQTTKDVLAVILIAERSRKYVWTAGRVLIEGGLVGRWEQQDSNEKKAILRRITKLLESLEADAVLKIRPELQGIGFGQEKGFDYIAGLATLNLPPAKSGLCR